ncbi:MAG: DUF4304 domain-containing protein [bacterium]|nr:DUF4304 domain-containing protein [bacterium]
MAWITDAIREIVDTGVAPVLKANGYRRKRRHWMLQLEDATRTLNVQSSNSNWLDPGRFTINLGLAHHDLEGRPEGFATWDDISGIPIRIGHVMPVRRDYWWELSEDDDFGAVAAEVEEALTRYALPWLGRCSDPMELVDDFFERDLSAGHGFKIARKLGIDVAQRSQRSLERWLSYPVPELLGSDVRESARWILTHLDLSAPGGKRLTSAQRDTIQALIDRDWPMGADARSEGEREDIRWLRAALDRRLANET